MFDYLIQVNLTTVNGMTLSEQVDPQNKKTVANVFFKVINTIFVVKIVSILGHGRHDVNH